MKQTGKGRADAGRQPGVSRMRAGWWLALATATLLSGCGSSDPTIETESLIFNVAAGANGDEAVAIDVVLVFDRSALARIADLPASGWFKDRQQIGLAFPTAVKTKSFELVPGQKSLTVEMDGDDDEAIGAFLFANYRSEGLHRARIDTLEVVTVQLGAKSFSIEPRS